MVLIGFLVLVLPGCSRDKQEQETEKSRQGAARVSGSDVPPGVEVSSITGEVKEVIDSGSFVFIRLDRGDNQIWATIPGVEVEVGEKITLLEANVFRKFYSKSLDRTFDELIFSTGIEGKSGDGRVGFGRGSADFQADPAAGVR
jgi:hypothetical protein